MAPLSGVVSADAGSFLRDMRDHDIFSRSLLTGTFLLSISAALCISCSSIKAQPDEEGSFAPRTVEQAVHVLKTEWLSEDDLDWIFRSPKNAVTAGLHLPFGTAVRNEWRLWSGNTELNSSCGTAHAEECSAIIFERLWESLRQEADPHLVRDLDCQFTLLDLIEIDSSGFCSMRVGGVLREVQEQIESQLPILRARLPVHCSAELRLEPTGSPDLECWVRAEFSERAREPLNLGRLLGWISWRNGFGVIHSPPEIGLPFHEKCSWPDRPKHFIPPDCPDPTDSTLLGAPVGRFEPRSVNF